MTSYIRTQGHTRIQMASLQLQQIQCKLYSGIESQLYFVAVNGRPHIPVISSRHNILSPLTMELKKEFHKSNLESYAIENQKLFFIHYFALKKG